MRKRSLFTMAAIVLLTMLAGSTLWSMPAYISYQGKLTDDMGDPVDSSGLNMQFRIYDNATSGTLLWEEQQTVAVEDGIYNVLLGSVTSTYGSFDPALFSSDNRWFEVEVDSEVMTPRLQVTSVAYSMQSGNADTLDGLDASALDQAGHVADTGNPHSVTAAQTGAATVSDITWGNLSGIPGGFADGVDNTGISSESDPTVLTSVKDGVSWGELTGIPGGFADGVDNTGISSESDPTVLASVKDGITWTEVASRPSGLDDGDDIGLTSESDPQVGSNTTNYVPKWNGSALISGSMFDNGNVGIGTASPSADLDVNGDINTSGSYWIDGEEAVTIFNENVLIGPSPSPSGTGNTMVGYLTGSVNTANNNTFIGRYAGQYLYTEDPGNEPEYNVFIGYSAGRGDGDSVYGMNNVFIGKSAGRNNNGNNNIFIGHDAGSSSRSSDNVFIGMEAGESTTNGVNTFLGNGTGRENTTGHSNTYVGTSAGYQNTTGYENTCVGVLAGGGTFGVSGTGFQNTFIGYGAGNYNDGGDQNTCLGYRTGYNTNSNYNTFIGFESGFENTTGYANTFVGYTAGYNNTTGRYNTFLGRAAGHGNTTGKENVYLGRNAGLTSNGDRNVFIGYNVGYYETGSNKLYIDNYSTSSPLIYGDFATNDLVINGDLEVTGSFVYGTSDERLKTNVHRITGALASLEQIRGVTFEWTEEALKNNEGKQIGVIAQEVEAMYPELVKTGREGYKAVDYTKLSAVLIEAVKEQQQTIEKHEDTIAKQQDTVNELHTTVAGLNTRLSELEKSKRAEIALLKQQFTQLQLLVRNVTSQQEELTNTKQSICMTNTAYDLRQ